MKNKKLSPEMRAFFSKNGKKGSASRWKGTTKKERSAHARNMALARHKKHFSTPAA